MSKKITAGEFTKKVRLSVQNRDTIIAKITDIEILAVIGWIPQLCDHLDTAEARNKDLLEALRQAFNESHNPKVKKILKVAIAKAKKGNEK